MTSRLSTIERRLKTHVSLAAIGSPISEREHARVIALAYRWLNFVTRIGRSAVDIEVKNDPR